MEMTPVESAYIQAIGHDPAASVLRVRFRDGKNYDYRDVSAKKYAAFISATSIGKHFHKHIRDVHQYEEAA